MDSDEKMLPRARGSHTSSSGISTPRGNGHTDDSAKDWQCLQEFAQSCPKKEFVRNLDKERKQGHLSKCKSTEELSKTTSTKGWKNSESKKLSSNHSIPMNNLERPRKQPRKGDNPARLPPMEVCAEFGCSNSWICKNSACKAVLTSDDTFCKRCSCCICHLFDDNKDPSLWLVCTSDLDDRDCCGLSCHVECARLRKKAGVVDLGQLMQLDGSYCCASCGKISGIIGFWKKQLAIAKEARRIDVLCHRIALCYKLLDGTSRFKELHEVVEQAKAKLETEVGSVDGVSAKMARGIVSRLSVAGDIQDLCSLAIEKADEWLSSVSMSDPKNRDSRPAACKFIFEEITSTSVVIVLKDARSASEEVKGYKLWYCKSKELPYKRDPVAFPKEQRRILVSNLLPCTEYAFKIISLTEDGDLGHSESKCFTKSVEIIHKHTEQSGAEGCSSTGKREEPKSPVPASSSGFRVRNLGKIVRLAWAQEDGCYDGICEDDVEESYDVSGAPKPNTAENNKAQPAIARQLDLNVVSVPDLNDDITPPIESSPENGCSSEKNGGARSNDSQTCVARPVGEVPERRKRSHEETFDGDSTVINISPLRFANGPGQLDDNYEYCVKIVRWLECTGHIEKDFRMKFLTWFSLRSTEQERRVVITFIRTLVDDPTSLAGQLLDTFFEMVTCKRPKTGFCKDFWH